MKDEWIKKLWYVHIMKYYLAIKRNTFESVLTRWMNLVTIIQSEVSQKEKNKYCILMCIYMKSRKMVLKKLFAGQQWKHRTRKQTYGHMVGEGRKERVGLMEREP